MATLEIKYETDPSSFAELSKADFDELVRSGMFSKGPVVEEHSEFMQEFGPYSPERWAFGRLNNGEYVKAKVSP
jgi:hypothetical protein